MVVFSETIADLTPKLKKLGYEIEVVRMQMFPPKGLLRLVSGLESEAVLDKISIDEDETFLKKAILVAAEKAKIIQKLLELDEVILDIELDINPTVRVSYKKADDVNGNNSARFSDIDLICGQAL